MPGVHTSCIAIGGNRIPSAADWSPSGLLAFGAGRCVALWNPEDPSRRGVYSALKAHQDRVNVVRFLPRKPPGDCDDNDDDDEIILSGAADATIRIWRRVAGSSPAQFTLVESLTGFHSGSINAIATCPQKPHIFASASSDNTVAVFSLSISPSSIEVQHLQTFSTKPKFFPLALALSALPSSDALILAVAGSTSSVSIYVCPPETGCFALQATLSGHENWVRTLSFTIENREGNGDLILASASQDKYIRLWRIHSGSELPAASANGDSKTLGLSNRLSNKAHKLRLEEEGGGREWSVTFEALLIGHEDWIYTVSWKPRKNGESGLQLLSASVDNSLSIWAPEESSGIWLTTSRLGEISDQKGSSTATGSVGGLWTALWSPSGNTVASLGKTGSWRVWNYNASQDRWIQSTGIGGHTKDVTGISWSKNGGYLLSTSLDQTTRLFAKWTNDNKTGAAAAEAAEAGEGEEKEEGSWHEFSRPQIHGYDINCISCLGTNRFVSGAEEKLLRVFDEPKGVAGLLENLCNIHESSKSTLPEAANQPVLGLSNKAIDASAPLPRHNNSSNFLQFDDEEEEEARKTSPITTPSPPLTVSSILESLPHPPLEDALCRQTLWPETEKLYGHGYEISSLATSPNGALIATACKASTPDHAVIRIFETETWRELKPPLKAHDLTVTKMKFSSDGNLLLSVGRDRMWCVFRQTAAAPGRFELVQAREKGHSRIIWDAGWAPVKGGVFVTGSRDKSFKIWAASDKGDAEETTTTEWELKATVKAEVPVTAVDFLQQVIHEKYWLAVGFEDGGLCVYSLDIKNLDKIELAVRFDSSITPDKSITQITWRPSFHPSTSTTTSTIASSEKRKKQEIAVSSEDSSVRTYSVII